MVFHTSMILGPVITQYNVCAVHWRVFHTLGAIQSTLGGYPGTLGVLSQMTPCQILRKEMQSQSLSETLDVMRGACDC